MPSDRLADGTSRQGSRLEVDDPLHCKQCGGELPEMMVFGPIAGDGTEYDRVELCGKCKGTEVKIRRAAAKKAERNHGVSINPWDLEEPPEGWELSQELWYEWSAEVQALWEKDGDTDV